MTLGVLFICCDDPQTAAIRNRILRSVDFAGALDELTSRDISSVGHEYTPEQYVYLHSFTSKVCYESSDEDVVSKASLAVPVYILYR